MEKSLPAKEGTVAPQHSHWVEKLAKDVLARASPPFVVTAGMTTSGPFHMGTLSEFLYPASVVRYLQREGEVKFLFSADVLDAFDAVPSTLSEHTAMLTPYLGKPLCDVPDPLGCCESFGEHFLNESLALVEKFGIAPKIRLASDDYRNGVYDAHAKLFCNNLQKVREVISTTSLNPNLPANWHPLMPVCSNCGRIATTEITSFDLEKYSYSYSCTRALKYTKGCGFSGTHKLSDHKYKLQWRVHWPSWMDMNGTHIEGGGMDHHTRGGSWDSAVGIFRDIFNKEPPISYKWGFVLFNGKKYSKSKGIGMGVTDLIKLVPPSVLAYALVRPDLEENRDINPSGESLLRLIDEYQGAAAMLQGMQSAPAQGGVEGVEGGSEGADAGADGAMPELSRAERKKALAYQLVSGKPPWGVQFSDLLIYHVLYRNWDDVAARAGHVADVMFLAPYAENWEKAGMVPAQYNFSFTPSRPRTEAGRVFFNRLSGSLSALDIHNLAFTVARENNAKPGEFFSEIYSTIISKPAGPKLGKLIEAIGAEKVKSSVLGA